MQIVVVMIVSMNGSQSHENETMNDEKEQMFACLQHLNGKCQLINNYQLMSLIGSLSLSASLSVCLLARACEKNRVCCRCCSIAIYLLFRCVLLLFFSLAMNEAGARDELIVRIHMA